MSASIDPSCAAGGEHAPPTLAVATRDEPGGPTHGETVHTGLVSVVTGDDDEIFAVGHTDAPFPLRSTAKPFQLLPYLLDGLHEQAPAAEPADLAVMMASHSGEPMHTERVAALLARWGLSPEALQCGVHPPLDVATHEALVRAGDPPSALHCNCSGKHAAMLAVCRERGWPAASYVDLQHPLQRRIRDLLLALLGRPPRPLPYAIDGCSLPTFVMPLVDLARLFARLACPDGAPLVEKRRAAPELRLLYQAGTRHPELIAGTGCLDTRLMRALPRRVFTKVGAAGLHAMAVAPSPAYPRGLGIAVKVMDGDAGARVRAVVAVELLSQLGLATSEQETAALDALAERSIVNLRRRVVGAIRPTFDLTGMR